MDLSQCFMNFNRFDDGKWEDAVDGRSNTPWKQSFKRDAKRSTTSFSGP